MSQLVEFRRDKDDFYRTDWQSPLTDEQKKAFKGLSYFDENPALKMEVGVAEFKEKQEITMQTSTGDIQTYRRFGRINFTVDGQEAELTIYADGDDFFLPFADALAGKETYGAGRYIEPVSLGKDKFLVDFNYAYNPYCAYNERWSCPIPPAENRLKVAIRAGEKIYKDQ